MDKLNKLSLPVTIIIASFILGAFYYASEISEQRFNEKQQQIFLEHEETEKQQQKLEEAEKKELLNNCIQKVDTNYFARLESLVQESGKCSSKTSETEKHACHVVYIEAFDRADLERKNETENCFNKYPLK